MKAWKKLEQGFTLAELLIVVAIIAVLVAVSIPIFSAQLEKSREETDVANLRSAYAIAQTDALAESYKKWNGTGWVENGQYKKKTVGSADYYYAYYNPNSGQLTNEPRYVKNTLGKGTSTQGSVEEMTGPLYYNEDLVATSSNILVVIPDIDGVAGQAAAGFQNKKAASSAKPADPTFSTISSDFLGNQGAGSDKTSNKAPTS